MNETSFEVKTQIFNILVEIIFCDRRFSDILHKKSLITFYYCIIAHEI
jgi:hypothetical protein